MARNSRGHLWLMRFDLAEVSGALGDLGTFIPLVVSLIAVCGMDAGSVLVFAGLFNVLSGLVFNQPIPVQPMKAIAAVAIAEGLAPGEIAAAGFATGIVIFGLSVLGLVRAAERWVPRPVVRGIQLGVGLKLAVTGLGMVTSVQWMGLDSRVVALAGAVLVLATAGRRFPSALIIFLAGLGVLYLEAPEVFSAASVGWSGPSLLLPTASEWSSGIARGALPQVPLTLLNSVIAVSLLSRDLFPERPVSAGRIATSVGVMNAAACLLGGMPACHGSGGLAGQYRFGARTGGSILMLGIAKIALGLAFGSAALGVLSAFPGSLLGLLLVFAGFELALPARECKERDPFFIALATAAGILTVNTGVGFVLGLVAALVLALREKRRG